MRSPESRSPDLMPVLARGSHWSARRGACVMEFASYLAGERWSDHPRCTHRVLAVLARTVNDHLDDAHRQRLLPLVPDLVGANPDDPRADAWIAREAALAALSAAALPRQGVAALGLLQSERRLNALEGELRTRLSPQVRDALDTASEAHAWALDFAATVGEDEDHFRRAAPAIVATSVDTIAASTCCDGQGRLLELLTDCVRLCREALDRSPVRSGGPAMGAA